MKRKLLLIIAIVLFVALGVGAYLYKAIWQANVLENDINHELLIYPSSDFAELCGQLVENKIINSLSSFQLVSKIMSFSDKNIKPGKYELVGGMSNRTLIQLLRSGHQKAIKLTFNNMRNTEELAGRISQQLYFDSTQLISYLSDTMNLKKWKVDKENLLAFFIPDTYEVFWSDPVHKIVERLMAERNKYWSSNNRAAKAENLGLSKNEVFTLASIVQKETNQNDEKARIAGVYLNRLERGIPLQADPTVVFAVGDFSIKRVLNKHLETKSPYNTYINSGLPPGPICMPDKSSIDAVLDFEKHRYLYFCSRPDYSGYHDFAKNLIQHNNNARRYHRWLNQERIK